MPWAVPLRRQETSDTIIRVEDEAFGVNVKEEPETLTYEVEPIDV